MSGESTTFAADPVQISIAQLSDDALIRMDRSDLLDVIRLSRGSSESTLPQSLRVCDQPRLVRLAKVFRDRSRLRARRWLQRPAA